MAVIVFTLKLFLKQVLRTVLGAVCSCRKAGLLREAELLQSCQISAAGDERWGRRKTP